MLPEASRRNGVALKGYDLLPYFFEKAVILLKENRFLAIGGD
jgi:hypothetical protein